MSANDHAESWDETAEAKGRPTLAEIERRTVAAHTPPEHRGRQSGTHRSVPFEEWDAGWRDQ